MVGSKLERGTIYPQESKELPSGVGQTRKGLTDTRSDTKEATFLVNTSTISGTLLITTKDVPTQERTKTSTNIRS